MGVVQGGCGGGGEGVCRQADTLRQTSTSAKYPQADMPLGIQSLPKQTPLGIQPVSQADTPEGIHPLRWPLKLAIYILLEYILVSPGNGPRRQTPPEMATEAASTYSTGMHPCLSSKWTPCNGGSRISLRWGQQLPKSYYFANFLPKTAWKLKKSLNPGVGQMSLAHTPPPRSTNALSLAILPVCIYLLRLKLTFICHVASNPLTQTQTHFYLQCWIQSGNMIPHNTKRPGQDRTDKNHMLAHVYSHDGKLNWLENSAIQSYI